MKDFLYGKDVYIYFLHILHCQVRNYLGDCISSVLFAFWPRYDEVNPPTKLIIIQRRGAQSFGIVYQIKVKFPFPNFNNFHDEGKENAISPVKF